MGIKIINFAVFAVLVVQNSLAAKKSSFSANLAEIQTDGSDTLEEFYTVVDAYFDTIKFLAKVNFENRAYDAGTIRRLQNNKKIAIAAFKRSYDTTAKALTLISENAAVLTDNLDEDYAMLKDLIEFVYSAFDEIPGKSYSESLAAIDAIEKTARSKVSDTWTRVYDVITQAVGSEDLAINNAIEVIRTKAMANGEGAFSSIFAGIKILLLELFGKTHDRHVTFSSGIEIERNFARVYLTDEVHTKFTLFQYIDTAQYVKDTTIMDDLNEIQIAELGAINQFEFACQSLITTVIELSENDKPSCTIEALSDKISTNMYPAILSGFSNVEIDQGAVYKKVKIMAHGMSDAVKLTQKSRTCGVRNGIDSIEKKVVAVAVNVFKETFDAMESTASRIGRDAVATIKSTSKEGSTAIHSGFTQLFTAIKFLLFRDTVGAQPGYCDTHISAIKIARDATFAGVKNETVFKFDMIRIFHLIEYQKANGIRVPFSTLLPA